MTLSPDDRSRLKALRKDLERAENELGGALVSRKFGIWAAADHGATLREIAEVLGVSHQMVHKIMQERES